jgi:hypothetical protein
VTPLPTSSVRIKTEGIHKRGACAEQFVGLPLSLPSLHNSRAHRNNHWVVRTALRVRANRLHARVPVCEAVMCIRCKCSRGTQRVTPHARVGAFGECGRRTARKHGDILGNGECERSQQGARASSVLERCSQMWRLGRAAHCCQRNCLRTVQELLQGTGVPIKAAAPTSFTRMQIASSPLSTQLPSHMIAVLIGGWES